MSKKYSVSIPYYASIIYEVEASNEKEAKEKAFEQFPHQPCCHCSKHIQIDGQADGEPSIFESEE